VTGSATLTPLPRSLDPLPGESLPGFVLRLAHRLDRTPARVMELVGLPEHASSGVRMGPVTHLHPSMARKFAAATRLGIHEVERMCLSSLTGRYSPLDPTFLGRRRDPVRLASAEPWVFGRWSRYCPQCLAGDGSPIQNLHGGAWQRTWRLPPVFACAQHRRLLADRCPDCRQPAMHLPSGGGRLLPCARAEPLHPAQCRNQVGLSLIKRIATRTPCGHRLDQTDAAAPDIDTGTRGGVVEAVMVLQQRILDLLDPAGPSHTTVLGELTPVSRYFTDLRLLANLICASWPTARPLAISPTLADHLDTHVAQRRELIADSKQRDGKTARHGIYDQPPAAAAPCAALIAIAERILTGDHHDLLGDLTDGPDGQRWSEHFIRAEPYCSPGLVAIAAPHVARYRRRLPNGRLPAKPGTTRYRRSWQPAAAGSAPASAWQAPQPVTPLPLRPAPHHYHAEHVPAFLPGDWYHQHLAHLRGADPRLLRRTAAIALVQLATPCRIIDAADLLGVPADPACYAYGETVSWVRHSHHGAAFLDAVHALADDLDTAAATGQLVNYHRRRAALADWRIPDPEWHDIAAELRRRARARADYGQRKRNTASALIWIQVTQGEHLFAPHRQSPTDYLPGSVQDWALSIDRAWWRTHHDQPGRHYPDLYAICTDIAEHLAQQIDHTGGATAATQPGRASRTGTKMPIDGE
jgi:TniQ